MTAPVVTVVMPVRNGLPYVEAARRQLESLRGPSLEVLVVDDASTDGTADAIDGWARADARVRVLVQAEQRGVAAARNRAVAEARGRWLWFVDCDDEWSPDIVARLVEVGEQREADVVCCQADSRHEDGEPGHELPGTFGTRDLSGDEALRWLLRGDIRGHLWNKLFARSRFDDVAFPATWAHSDLGAMGDLLVGARRVTVVDDVLYTYILRPSSIIGSGAGRARDLLTVLDRIHDATLRMADRTGVDDDLDSFAYREVYLPTLHKQFRRRTTDEADLAVRREIRRRISVGATARVVRSGAPVAAVATVSAAYAAPVHAPAYRILRGRRWSSGGSS